MKKIYSLIFLIILSTSIISCGYQLRNAPEINFDSISINGGSSGFIKILKKKFKQSGIQINSEDSELILDIVNDIFSKKILSLSSSGKVKEYQIIYKVSFRTKQKNTAWSSPITIETMRDYTYDDKNINAKTKEEARLIIGMQEQLIRRMVTQISVSK